ncbi:amidase domain-containing protein [Natronincola ferrireducens]|uniref:Putative amidase domain-containing protein n=1 Tax=Natronincola ferrireducens TaxID=393762 RepID=A0A1G9DUU6_9FIRM|nr:amidase domain-containing protein [Natronincola ferrireducens]SDK67647.1 Putative amidase domain-containing protein [Natronincola ferrireducens]
MVIILRLRKVKIILLLIGFLIISGVGLYLWGQLNKTSSVFIDENLNNRLTLKMQQVFHQRNKALLEGDVELLSCLYDKDVRNGLWAYEHDFKKMKYFHNWSDKQGVEFKNINSHVVVKSVKEKGDGFAINLAVSTEYQYVYIDTPEVYNSFRTGTYHSLDLMPKEDTWVITREWYTDPFADSLDLDEISEETIRQLILSGEPKDLSDLSEKRIAVVVYADQYCGAAVFPEFGYRYNYKYKNYNYQGGDCANFASQILYEAGKFKKNSTWNYEKGAGSKAWVNARAFNSYMRSSGRGSVIAHGTYDKVLASSYKLLPGDYIAYEKQEKVTHISVVTGFDSKGYPLVNSHNSDRYRVPWDLGWSNKGIKFGLVRVHY